MRQRRVARWIAAVVLTVSGALSGELAFGRSGGQVVRITSQRLFVPQHWNGTERVQVVLEGVLPSACHDLAPPVAEVDAESRSVEVTAIAVRRSKSICSQTLVPFSVVVDLGVLPFGAYRIYTNDSLADEELLVTEARSGGTEIRRYAEIESARIETTPTTGHVRRSVVLNGVYRNRCERLDRVEVRDAGGDTIEVFPILAPITRGFDDCAMESEPFTARAELPDIDEAGRYLLHVRTAGGSVNHVFNTLK